MFFCLFVWGFFWFFVVVFFCWPLLICENTPIQVKQKKKRKNHVSAEHRSRLAGIAGRHDSTRLRTLTQLADVNFTTYFFSREKMPIDMNIPGKMCSNRRKNHGCGQKKKTVGTNFTIFGSKTAAKCCELKNGADRVCSRTGNKDEVLKGKT